VSSSPLPPETIWLERSTDGKTFEQVASASTNQNGEYQFSQMENNAGSYYYRTTYQGSDIYYLSSSKNLKTNVRSADLWINGPNFIPGPEEPFLITGTLRTTSALPHETISLERSINGLSFKKIAETNTDEHGEYYFWQTEKDTGSYYRTFHSKYGSGDIVTSDPLKIDVVLNLNKALDNEQLKWVVGGANYWFGTTKMKHYGIGSAQSGPISDGQKSVLITDVEGPGSLQFLLVHLCWD